MHYQLRQHICQGLNLVILCLLTFPFVTALIRSAADQNRNPEYTDNAAGKLEQKYTVDFSWRPPSHMLTWCLCPLRFLWRLSSSPTPVWCFLLMECGCSHFAWSHLLFVLFLQFWRWQDWSRGDWSWLMSVSIPTCLALICRWMIQVCCWVLEA